MILRRLLPVFVLFAAGSSVEAAELPPYAERLTSPDSWLHISNSLVMVGMAAMMIIVFSAIAMRKVQLIPRGAQNFCEWLVETLYSFLEGILGPHLVKRTFWFFGALFFLILTSNWMGMLPGVGTVFFVPAGGEEVPLLRGGNADLNMTSAMALAFAFLWFYWAISENGVKGFFGHIFAPKGQFHGLMRVFMVLIFLFVGVLEVISIMIRPVAFSFRLFGNVFAGETILETMIHSLGKDGWYLSWMAALPFYFFELLVGFVQALVFVLLGAVFLKIICTHDDHGPGHEDGDEKKEVHS